MFGSLELKMLNALQRIRQAYMMEIVSCLKSCLLRLHLETHNLIKLCNGLHLHKCTLKIGDGQALHGCCPYFFDILH